MVWSLSGCGTWCTPPCSRPSCSTSLSLENIFFPHFLSILLCSCGRKKHPKPGPMCEFLNAKFKEIHTYTISLEFQAKNTEIVLSKLKLRLVQPLFSFTLVIPLVFLFIILHDIPHWFIDCQQNFYVFFYSYVFF